MRKCTLWCLPSKDGSAWTSMLSYQSLLGTLWIEPIIMKTCHFKYVEISPPKNWKFSDKNSDIFYISAQNIDYGCSLELPHRGSSNQYPQSMFLCRSKKNNVYPSKPQFYYVKVGFKGSKLYRFVFVMDPRLLQVYSEHNAQTDLSCHRLHMA